MLHVSACHEVVRDWICQAIYKSGNLTQNLQQLAQETNPFSPSPGPAASLLPVSQTCWKSDQHLW